MFKRILVAIDLEFGDDNHRILQAAREAAEADGADLHLVSVVAAAPALVSQFLHENYEQLASGQAAAELASLGDGLDLKTGKVSSSVRFGVVYEEVIAAAESLQADLIITGAYKPHVTDFLLGTNAARVVRHASCSVLVVRPGADGGGAG